MIHEWLNDDGTITRFDSNTSLVTILGPNYAPIEDPRPATEAEQTKHDELFPPAPETPTSPTGVSRTELVGRLMSGLLTMRQINADANVTTEEIVLANTTVTPTLYLLRDYGHTDEQITLLTNLLLAQVIQSILTLIGNAGMGLKAAYDQQIAIRQDLQALRDDFEAYKSEHP